MKTNGPAVCEPPRHKIAWWDPLKTSIHDLLLYLEHVLEIENTIVSSYISLDANPTFASSDHGGALGGGNQNIRLYAT